jgi:hypothetical protein
MSDRVYIQIDADYYLELMAVAEAAEKVVGELERKQHENAFLINELFGLRNALHALKGEPTGNTGEEDINGR